MYQRRWPNVRITTISQQIINHFTLPTTTIGLLTYLHGSSISAVGKWLPWRGTIVILTLGQRRYYYYYSGAIRFLIAGSNTYFLSLPPSYPPPTSNGYFPYINLRGQGAL